MSRLPTLKTLSKQIDWLSFELERVRTPPEPLFVPYKLVKKNKECFKNQIEGLRVVCLENAPAPAC